jgi:cytochrome c553
MKRFLSLAAAGVGVAIAALAQSKDFSPPPPAWQVALAGTTSTAAGEAIATSGKGAAIACAGCHGTNGIAPPGTPFPRLAGLPLEYVAKQLFDYREGSRSNPMMTPIAKALTDADIASLARYYASMDPPSAKADSAGASPRARHLARYGDNALAIPACIDCHGSDETGAGPILPPLAQSAPYMTAQLQAFRSGERHNDGENVMREMAKRLSDADIKALSDYYAGR